MTLLQKMRAAAFGMLLMASMFGVAPVALAQSVPCFTKDECLQGATTAGNCSDTRCFETGGNTGCVAPQGLCYARPPLIPLTIKIGGVASVRDIGDYVLAIYRYGLAIAGVVAGVTMVIGGFQFMTGEASKGKERIKNSLIGVALVFGAYVILLTINPDLVRLRLPKVPIIKKSVFVGCVYTESCYPCGMPYDALRRDSDGKTAESSGECQFAADKGQAPNGFSVVAECVGKGCDTETMKTGTSCGGGVYRCKSVPKGTAYACGAKPEGAVDGYACQGCTPDGERCARAGAGDECCGGFCAQSILASATGGGAGPNWCASGQPGDRCQDDTQCVTGNCQENWGNSCSAGTVGSPCSENAECTSGYCSTVGGNACTTGGDYSRCDSNDECISQNCVSSICLPANVNTPFTCNTIGKNEVDCGKGGYCFDATGSNICTDGAPGNPCTDDNQCANSRCARGVCVTGENGAACDENADCNFSNCVIEAGDFGVCTSGKKGARCDSDVHCKDKLKCIQNRCTAS